MFIADNPDSQVNIDSRPQDVLIAEAEFYQNVMAQIIADLNHVQINIPVNNLDFNGEQTAFEDFLNGDLTPDEFLNKNNNVGTMSLESVGRPIRYKAFAKALKFSKMEYEKKRAEATFKFLNSYVKPLWIDQYITGRQVVKNKTTGAITTALTGIKGILNSDDAVQEAAVDWSLNTTTSEMVISDIQKGQEYFSDLGVPIDLIFISPKMKFAMERKTASIADMTAFSYFSRTLGNAKVIEVPSLNNIDGGKYVIMTNSAILQSPYALMPTFWDEEQILNGRSNMYIWAVGDVYTKIRKGIFVLKAPI